ncbi:MAG TPA: prepilin peptidase [Sulfurospirillum sp. UBA11407]|nr:MAG TPA: prepilin peptidase [Sulfurospirillum sp. UBA11407]
MELFIFVVLGVCVGSFLNVLILRLPLGKSVAFPASYCPKCKNPLKWYHNIPIFSWLFLRGKCAFCDQKISFQYPLIELLSGLIFLLAFSKSQNMFEAFIIAIVFSLLLALSAIDLKYKAVPDNLSIPALLLAPLSGNFLTNVESALLLAGGFALLRIIISWIIKKEAMGEADIIIAGVIGGILGVKLGLSAIYIAALICLPVFFVVSKRGYELPFIPFLSIGLFVTWCFETEILRFLGMIYE